MAYTGPDYTGKLAFFGCPMGNYGSNALPDPDPLWVPIGKATGNQWGANAVREVGTLAYYQSPVNNPPNGSVLHGQNWTQRIAAMNGWAVANGAWGPLIGLYGGENESVSQFIQYLQLIAPYAANSYQIVANELNNPAIGPLAALGGAGSTGWDGLAGMVKLCRQYLPSSVKLGLNDFNACDYTDLSGSGLTSSLFNYNKQVAQYQACASLGAPLDFVGVEAYWGNYALSVTDYQGNPITAGVPAYTSASSAMANATGCPIFYTEFTPYSTPAGGFPSIYTKLMTCVQAFLQSFVASKYVVGVFMPYAGFRKSQLWTPQTGYDPLNWLYNDLGDGATNGDGTAPANGIVPTLTWLQGYVPQIISSAPPPTGPFGGSAPSAPITIICSAYDYGGQGIGYNFNQNGGQTVAQGYRSDGYQNLKTNTDTFSSNPYVVGYGIGGTSDATDNWTAYTVNVPSSGSFSFSLRCGTASGGTFHLSIDGNDTPAVTVAAQGAWDTAAEWVSVQVPGSYNLTAGNHLIKIVIDVSALDINLLVISYSGAVRVLHFDAPNATANPTSGGIVNTIGESPGSELLLHVCTYNNVSGTVPLISSVSDTVNGTYTLISGPVTSGHITTWLYSRNNIAKAGQAGNTATVVFTAALNGNLNMVLVEVTGQNLSSSLDVAGSAFGTGTAASVSVTTTNANDSVLVFGYTGSAYASGGSNFNNVYNVNTLGTLLDILPLTATGTYTDAPTLSPSGNWALIMVALKSAGSLVSLGGNAIPSVSARGTITVTHSSTSFSGTQTSKVVASGALGVSRTLGGRTN